MERSGESRGQLVRQSISRPGGIRRHKFLNLCRNIHQRECRQGEWRRSDFGNRTEGRTQAHGGIHISEYADYPKLHTRRLDLRGWAGTATEAAALGKLGRSVELAKADRQFDSDVCWAPG